MPAVLPLVRGSLSPSVTKPRPGCNGFLRALSGPTFSPPQRPDPAEGARGRGFRLGSGAPGGGLEIVQGGADVVSTEGMIARRRNARRIGGKDGQKPPQPGIRAAGLSEGRLSCGPAGGVSDPGRLVNHRLQQHQTKAFVAAVHQISVRLAHGCQYLGPVVQQQGKHAAAWRGHRVVPVVMAQQGQPGHPARQLVILEPPGDKGRVIPPGRAKGCAVKHHRTSEIGVLQAGQPPERGGTARQHPVGGQAGKVRFGQQPAPQGVARLVMVTIMGQHHRDPARSIASAAATAAE